MKTKYYLTVFKDDNEVIKKKMFFDFAEAMAACAEFYKPRFQKGTLLFYTESLSGKFARSYASLSLPESIKNRDSPEGNEAYHSAVKSANAFLYDADYHFLIESELGIRDSEEFYAEDAEKLE